MTSVSSWQLPVWGQALCSSAGRLIFSGVSQESLALLWYGSESLKRLMSLSVWAAVCPYHRPPPLTASHPPLQDQPPPCAASGCARGCTPSEGDRHRPAIALRPGESRWRFGRAFPAESHRATASTSSTSALPACEWALPCLLVPSLFSLQKQEDCREKFQEACCR